MQNGQKEIITEAVIQADLDNAGTYDDNHGCLIATLLKRSNIKATVYPSFLTIGDTVYKPATPESDIDATELLANPGYNKRHYKRSLIGKRFHFVERSAVLS